MPHTESALAPEDHLPLSAAVLAILVALAGSEKHGYAIMQEVRLPEGGNLAMGPGTLYGSLDRMVASLLVEETGTTDNERRRYYRITEFGLRVLHAESERLGRLLGSTRPRRAHPRHSLQPAETI